MLEITAKIDKIYEGSLVITPKIDPQKTERKGSDEQNHAAPCSSGTGWKPGGVFRDAIH